MPNMEELISRISRKIADGASDQIWISKFDLDYAYGQMQLSKHAMDLCIFAITGGNFTGYYRFLKGFYGLADIPTIFQEKIDQTLENKHPAWLDDILVVTKGTKEQHTRELIEVLTKLKNAGYRLSENRTEFYKTEIEWVGHKIDQNGIRPLQDKLKAIQELKEPKNEKELKSFLGAIQYLSKYIENLSAQTDLLRQLLKKTTGTGQRNTPKHSMEEGEISSDSEMAPSVLEVPTINWANYLGIKSVQYIKMGPAPRIQAIEPNNWDHENTVRETEKKFATDLQLLMTETTNDPKLLKTLVCLERKQYDSIPEEYNQYKRNLSTRYGLVFFEEKIIVPANLRTTVISLLHKGHPAINKMTIAAKHFWWPKLTEAIQRKCDSCIPCKLSGKNLKPNLPKTEQNHLPPLNSPNEEIQLDFIGPIAEENRRFYILLSIDRYSKWPAASLCKITDGETAVKFLQQYIQLNGIPKNTNR